LILLISKQASAVTGIIDSKSNTRHIMSNLNEHWEILGSKTGKKYDFNVYRHVYSI